MKNFKKILAIFSICSIILLSGCAKQKYIQTGGINHDLITDVSISISPEYTKGGKVKAKIFIINPKGIDLEVYQVNSRPHKSVKRKHLKLK